jgi:hypothetical protein
VQWEGGQEFFEASDEPKNKEKCMSIKAIETVYNGYRFRSRLEARWAVFLDAANIRYLYEPEGFDLDGLHYLPDFWLPDLQAWVEIKPGSYRRGWYRWNEETRQYVAPDGAPAKAMDVPEGFYEDLTKLRRLVEATGCPGFMLFDEIEPLACTSEFRIVGSNKIWWPANRNPWKRESGHDDGCCEWAECPLCGKTHSNFHTVTDLLTQGLVLLYVGQPFPPP